MEVGVRLLTYLAVVLVIAPAIKCQGFEKPPFSAAPHRDEVEFDYIEGRGAVVNMEEEIVGDVLLVKINYKGSSRPKVSVTNGIESFLGGEIRKMLPSEGTDPDNSWYLVITKRQDYEISSMQKYTINVIITEGTNTYIEIVFLSIINIDDNPPVIEPSSCEIPELYVGLSNCTYKVTDVDGFISIDVMTFVINGRANEENIFKLKEEKNSINPYEMTITLETVQELDFDKSQLHIFTITAFDSLPNNGSTTAIVQVIDVPNMPPLWKSIFATQVFDEKTRQEFTVMAIDGDTQINKKIQYKLIKQANYTFFDIGKDSGILTVAPIDRDALQQEVFTFDISAYKFDNESWSTDFTVVILVNDINDNLPLVSNEEFELFIDEETYMSLAFDPTITIHDIDLGENAQYNVMLESVFPPEAADAFFIIPNEGYQKQEFNIIITNATKLDFEETDWQNITLKIRAEEKYNKNNFSTAIVKIHLINWNDEEPIFEKTSYVAQFNETVAKGYVVGTVRARDRDIGDFVEHSLVGSVSSYLDIDIETGVITVAVDNAFDYQRQSEIIVQVKAQDTLFNGPYHVAYAQLVITLLDVNRNNPEIRMPATTPRVDENVPKGHLITDEIIGLDVDKRANITFSINWDTSYATKQGRATPEEAYRGCVDIITEYPDPAKKGNAIGRLVAEEIRLNQTIDFEMFEVLYLTIQLKDENQEIGTGISEGTLTLIIGDVNDNWPVWADGSLNAIRFVREMSENNVVIGSVLANDIDGPLYNNVTYSLRARNDTPAGWVSIDAVSGQLDVLAAKAIDADTPPRYELYYDLMASDCVEDRPEEFCWTTNGQIAIKIIDTNNKVPEVAKFNNTVYISEDAKTGTDIVNINGTDKDRDEIYRKIAFSINYREHPDLRNFFSVEELTGRVFVDLKNGEELDRDNGVLFHDVFVILTDNYLEEGDRNMNTAPTEVRVVLLDVNDNAPQLPPAGTYSWTISENAKKNTEVKPVIFAPDKDEPDTDNSRVNYIILNTTQKGSNPKPFPVDLMTIQNSDNVTGILTTNHDLKQFWGTYDLFIKAYDLGIPTQSTNMTYQLTVTPYNFDNPKFTFPQNGTVLRLAKELAEVNGVLFYTNNSRLGNVDSIDDDGLEAGVVTYEVIGPEVTKQYFTVDNIGGNKGRLTLIKPIDDDHTTFQIIVRATDGGTDPSSLSTDVSFVASFIATQGDPIFESRTATVNFTELSQGLTENQTLPEATDPKNKECVEDCFEVFYYIVDGASKDLFSLDKITNTLTLKKELNRTEAVQHTISIAASNSATAPDAISSPDSIVTVTIVVKEGNPKPKLEQKVYTAGISITDNIGKLLFHIKATHTENLKIEYEINAESMQADPSLQSVKDRAFILDKYTGDLNLNFRQQDSMSGKFQFQVIATDTAGKVDTAEVTIFLISDENRISFLFDNYVLELENNTLVVAKIFSDIFKYTCNVDYILKGNDNGIPLDDQTEVRTHFIEDNVAIDATIIEAKKNDIALMRSLRKQLQENSLYLSDIKTNLSSNVESLEKMLQIVLIIVSTVLGTLCIALIVAYCLRTRNLNRRLKALSTTKFGSQDSGLNRIGAAVPGTNKHTLEGSNPVWNEEMKQPEFDAISNTSGDSDLIGVEDNPQFAYDNLGNEKTVTPPNKRKVTVYGINEHGA